MQKPAFFISAFALTIFISTADLRAQEPDGSEEGKTFDSAQEWAQRLKFVIESARYKIEERGIRQLLRGYRDGIEWRIRKNIEERRESRKRKIDDPLVVAPAPEEKEDFYESLKDARQVARAQNRLLVVKVGAKW